MNARPSPCFVGMKQLPVKWVAPPTVSSHQNFIGMGYSSCLFISAVDFSGKFPTIMFLCHLVYTMYIHVQYCIDTAQTKETLCSFGRVYVSQLN